MYIGIIYDSHTGDYWYRVEKDINSINAALSSIKLPLPVAGIFHSSKNNFVRLDHKYRAYRTELLRIAKIILRKHIVDNSRDDAQRSIPPTSRKSTRQLK